MLESTFETHAPCELWAVYVLPVSNSYPLGLQIPCIFNIFALDAPL